MEKISLDHIQQALLGHVSPKEVDEIISYLNGIKNSDSDETVSNIITALKDSKIRVSGNIKGDNNIIGNDNILVVVNQLRAKDVDGKLKGILRDGTLNDKLLSYVTSLMQDPEFSNWGKEHYFSLYVTPNQIISNIDLLLVVRDTGDIPKRELQYTFTAEEAIAKFKQLVIIGQPGSGKTTTLRNLTLVSAQKYQAELNTRDNNSYVPVFIRLPNYNSVVGATPYDRFLAMIKYAFQEFHLDLMEEEIRDILQRKKLILFLDGLNEIGNSDSTSNFIDGLNTFVAAFSQHHVVMTSRSYNFRLGKQRLPVLELLELKYPYDVKEYLTRYFANKLEIKKIMDVFENNLGLRQLATNPLLLFLIVVIFKNQHGVLPGNRSLLLEKIAYGLLGDWGVGVRSKQSNRFWVEDKHKLLQSLGRKMKFEGLQLSKTRVVDIMKASLLSDLTHFSSDNKRRPLYYETVTSENIEYLFGELKRDRILFEIGNSDKIRFWHQTLQEYFAAVCVLNEIVLFDSGSSSAYISKNNLEALVLDESWHEILSLVCGLVISSENIKIPLSEKVFRQLITFIWGRNKVLASLCMTNVDDPTIALPYVNQLRKTIFTLGISVPRIIPWILSIFLIVLVWILPEFLVNTNLPVALAPFLSIIVGVIVSLIFFRVYVSIIDFYEIFVHQKFIRPSIIALGYMKNKPAEKVLSEFNDRTVHDFSVSDRTKFAMQASGSLIYLSEENLLAMLEKRDNRSLQILEILGERGLRETINPLSLFLIAHISELDNLTFDIAVRSVVHLIRLHNVSKNEISDLINALNTIVIDERYDYPKRSSAHKALISMGFTDTKSPTASKEIRIYIIRYILLGLAIISTVLARLINR